ncbi:MarR family winged helix-turn-helix transcriptional regulator [Ramlibacter tataouinensis]|uniref:Transcriptional regulator, MarR family-like protein n=1 Tax=Ramlibacter tataouinensis (strain ATCC BAA-407 / DSM 14655 / LMG 21543 / TTB310) TaxID=365046 RepID=F5Y133_RAMTT|nr:MarR family transcriptional regulator [Ramlibacter tataouinensis]AEG92251.1 transcriptional regulator, MarR family-like protein [Ramlibacter tataouinensis TTB310]
MEPKKTTPLDKAALERISTFRYQLRRFLRFSEDASRSAGITMLQYQVLLHTQGFAGREWASIGELADRLQAQPHGVVALVTRCEQAGLVRRLENKEDRRLVEVHLTAKGRRCLDRLAVQHQAQLGALAAVIEAARAGAK